MRRLILWFFFASALANVSCAGDTVPAGLALTPTGTGPAIVFDLTAQPLPIIPLPNDVATFPDPTSRTGLRLNASLSASTHMEIMQREGFDDMEGWGTYQAITVTFTREAGADPTQPAIDLDNVRSRMQGDDFNFSNDPVYLINLTTGLPVPLDVGAGDFPLTVSDPTAYYPNDVKLLQQNLLFETVEEGAGLTQADYQPSLDQDFDGVLDHPDTFGTGQFPGVDNLLTWYESETDTLRVRPLLPLEEKTQYAVVLTDRLSGPDGQPVRSPFPFVYHPSQEASITALQSVLSNVAHAPYFGDIAGTGLAHVAFAWSFTTQPVNEDMRLLRDGLYAQGPFARFAAGFPPVPTLFPAVGLSTDPSSEPPNWQSNAACAGKVSRPYTVSVDQFASTLDQIYGLAGYSGTTLQLLEQTATTYIDHVVIGTFPSPFLMGDPADPDPDTRFHLNFQTGAGDVTQDLVHFYIVVPKTNPAKGFKQPFPVAFWGHGVTGNDAEVMTYAGPFARQGIAMIAFDAPEHGLVLTQGQVSLATGFLQQVCLAPWVTAITSGRAHDLNGDGIPDPGGLWWTPHMFHTRDNVRQAILDSMQATRMLRTFDGKTLATQDYNNDGKLDDLAGDFDADGTPDLGGPSVPIYASGESLGGFLSEIQGGIDPNISASAPVSGGGGGAYDIALRSYGVATPVMLQVLSPLVFAIPATLRPPDSNGNKQTQCSDNQRSVRWYVSNLTNATEIEIACLNPNELAPKMTVVVSNSANGEVRCSRTWSALPDGTPDSNGRFRIPIPASIGDPIAIQVYNAPDVVDSYKTCNVTANAPLGRQINTWEQAALSFTPVADPTAMCPSSAANGCQQFRETFYEVGTALLAPQEGLGLSRQTPTLRRLIDLVQAAFDPADPVNFAPYYMMRPLLGVGGQPTPAHGLLSIDVIGDGFVNISSGIAVGRAAGAVPFLGPNGATSFPDYADYATPGTLYAQWGETANDLLIENHIVEGVARFGYTPAGAGCGVNYSPSTTCTSPPQPSAMACQDALYDADWFDEGEANYAQQHSSPPLRGARDATVHASDATSLAAAWAPRVIGAPFSSDGAAWKNPLVALASMYFVPTGQHSFDAGDPCQAFDTSTYLEGTMARFFASGGTDLYYLSHPSTHRCLANQSCDFEQ
jgi:hypothetical protein